MNDPAQTKKTPWYAQSPADVLTALSVSEQGLSANEANERLARFGQNKLPDEKQRGFLRILAEQFLSPLIYVLITADIIVFALREYTDGFIILFVLLFNAILGAIQEGRAQHTLAALKQFTETKAEVLRDGRETIIPDSEIVAGDIIVLSEGGKIPADARLIEARSLKTGEGALTGESEPVRKHIDALSAASLPTAEQRNMVFKGTNVAVGYGKAVVVATGIETVIGRISKAIASIESEIPLARNLRDLARVVVVVVIALTFIIFFLGLLDNQPFSEMFVTAVAISVAAIPEGLPLVLTVILAAGVWRMAKRRVLVKKLQAVEALGQAQDIAVDKTGTITKNELVIQRIVFPDAAVAVPGIGYDPNPKIEAPSPSLILAGTIATCCSNAHVVASENGEFRVTGDPTEGAMTVFAEKVGITRKTLAREYTPVNDWPFDYERKYHKALYRRGGENFLALAGAPEKILEFCTTVRREEKNLPLDEETRGRLHDQFIRLSQEGLRVIAFAFAILPSEASVSDALPPLTFAGFYAMHDALRAGIRAEIAKAKEAGIRVIMITGDHAVTARAIAEDAGIYQSGDDVLTGDEIDALSAQEFAQKLPRTTVFARVTPEHKMKIIQDYKRRGDVIAMTGDGVNDAPSLVAADLGIAMGKVGTEVAKEASDLILLDDNFGDIIGAVEEGRNMRQGIRRTITYLFSSNLGEILLIATALLIRDPLPLLAAQIIWMNLVTDTFFDISLALEPKDASLMQRRARIPKKLFDRSIMTRLFILAPAIGFGTFFLFHAATTTDIAYARTMALTGLVVFQWFNAWNCRSETKSIFSLNPFSNRFLLLTFFWVVALQLFALYTPFLNRILKLIPLSASDWLRIIGFASIVIIAEETRKFFARRRLVPFPPDRRHAAAFFSKN